MLKRKVQVKPAGMSDAVAPSNKEAMEAPKKHGKFFWTCGILLVLFIVLVVVYFVLAQNLAHKYLVQGNQQFQQHLYTEANQDFVFASALSFFGKQTDTDAYAGQGIVADLQGNHELSASNFKKSLAKKSNDAVREKYAEQLYLLNRYSEAVSELSKIQNQSDSVLYLLAHAELRQDNFDAAKNAIEKISEAANDTTTKNEHLAYFALRDHSRDFILLYPQLSDADLRTYAEKALQSKSYSAVDLVTLGNFLLQKGEPDFALDFATSALQIENNYRDALVLQAQAHAARQEYEKAQESLDAAMKISLLNKDLWYMQGQIFEAQENHSEALASYKKASELGEDTALFHVSYARVARNNADADTAISEAKRALKLEPENDRVYLQFIFWTALDAQNFTEMKDAATKYVVAHPDEEFGSLAKAFAELKLQNIEAIGDVIAKAYAKNPNSAFGKYLHAVTKTDDIADDYNTKARKLLNEAIDFDTNVGSNGEVAKHAQEAIKEL